VQLDLSNDYLCWDNVESVTLQSTRKGNMTCTLGIVLRGQLSNKEIAKSGGAYTGLDLTFLIPNAQLPAGTVPKPADVITDGSNTAYTVLQVNGQCKDANGFQVWQTICRDPIIAYDLQDLVNIERATLSTDDTGAVVKTFPPVGGQTPYANLPCRVQVLNEAITDQRLIHAVEGSYAVYVSMQLAVNVAEDRIKWTPRGSLAPQYLDMVTYHDAQLIDQLPVIEARLRP